MYKNQGSDTLWTRYLHFVAAFKTSQGRLVEVQAVGVDLLANVVENIIPRLAFITVSRIIIANTTWIQTHWRIHTRPSLQKIPSSATSTGACVLIISIAKNRHRSTFLWSRFIIPLHASLAGLVLVENLTKCDDGLSLNTTPPLI